MAMLAALGGLAFPLSPALAKDGIVLDLEGSAEREVVRYECEGAEPFEVEYVNLPGNALAIVPVEGDRRLFVNVVSASGAKYVSGQFVWWSKGQGAQLFDEIEGGEPLSCESAEGAR